MSEPENRANQKQPMQSKQAIARASVVASGSLTMVKFLVGFLTGSLGLLAEGAHSLLDLVSTVITLVVVRVTAVPPDRNHPYRHERAEHLGALAGMFLLAGIAVFILYHAVEKIFVHPGAPEVNIWSFVVLILSVVVDFSRTRTLRKAAASHSSSALASDAEHFANDMLGSIAVLIGLGIVAVSNFFPLPAWLVGRIDALAALAVAVIAFRSVWKLASLAVRALMDDVPPDLSDRLRRRVESVDGVVPDTVILRTRYVGNRPYVEVRLGTPRGASLELAHQITEVVERAINVELGNAEAIVHVEPSATPDEPLAVAVRAIADRLGLKVHNLNIFHVGQQVRIELDLELADTLSLAEAHRRSESLENSIIREIPNSDRVTIHLEPRNDEPRPAIGHVPSTQRVQEALAKLGEAAKVRVQDVLVTDNGLVVTLEKDFSGDIPLAETHNFMARLERAFRASVPDVIRVHINPEVAKPAK